jgi:hypothetical protein
MRTGITSELKLQTIEESAVNSTLKNLQETAARLALRPMAIGKLSLKKSSN